MSSSYDVNSSGRREIIHPSCDVAQAEITRGGPATVLCLFLFLFLFLFFLYIRVTRHASGTSYLVPRAGS